jgi:hypothetical protein
MRFLPGWLTRWLPSGARSSTDSEDLVVSRFIISRTLRLKGGGFRLKTAAFMPRALDLRPELSVFRINGLSAGGIWNLAQKHVVPKDRNVHGRADLTELDIETTAPPLKLEMDETPPRHGNIVDWPNAKDEQLALAQELAARASHHELGEDA